MARIRTIKPEFWTDEKMVELSPIARLLFVGLWNFADDEGRMVYSPRRIKMQILPADEVDIRGVLGELRQAGRIRIYTVESVEYLDIPHFLTHQKIDKPSRSKLPPFNCAFGEDSGSPRDGREGKGRDLKTPPPSELPRTTPGPDPEPTAGADEARATAPPDVVAHVDRLRVTPGAGTELHAKIGELHGICAANSVRCSTAHPMLVDWAREGLTAANLTRAITEARKSKAGELNPAYLERILERIRDGTLDAKPAPAPISASHSTEKARQAIEEGQKAASAAVPMPDSIRDQLSRILGNP